MFTPAISVILVTNAYELYVQPREYTLCEYSDISLYLQHAIIEIPACKRSLMIIYVRVDRIGSDFSS